MDYDKHETLVTALRGQDALVISLAGTAPKDTELNLVNAAGEAGVKWIFPNEWSPDTAHQGLLDDLFIFPPKRKLFTGLHDAMQLCAPCHWSMLLTIPCRADARDHREAGQEFPSERVHGLLVRMVGY